MNGKMQVGKYINKTIRNADIADLVNFAGSFISAWNDGKREAPPNANEIVPKAVKKESTVTSAVGTVFKSLGQSMQDLIIMRQQAMDVVAVAMTAKGHKFFGVPRYINGTMHTLIIRSQILASFTGVSTEPIFLSTKLEIF